VPDDELRPSYEELAALVVSLRAELREAQARIAELEARLGANSGNSGRPPSSDGLAKPAPRSLRDKTGRKPGGQPSHKGETLRQVAVPTREQTHEPGPCHGCGRSLSGRPVTGVERRQCFDLPPVSIEVTEHQLLERECSCGVRTRAAAPVGVDAPVQYGPRIAAIVVYLYVGQFLSQKRTAQALSELFGTPLSEGTVAAITSRAAGRLDGFLDLVRQRLTDADVAGFDETGLRVAGRLHWVHCARTSKYTLLAVHPKRGRAGIDGLGVLPGFHGVAIHDAWAPYDTYTVAGHQLCHAHALRELQAVIDTTAAGGGKCWAAKAAAAMVAMQKLVTAAIAAGHDSVDETLLAQQVRRYRSATVTGANQTAAGTDALSKKHNALALRLLGRQGDYLRFTKDWRIPPDNNGCERDIRMIKLRQKVSGCLRTFTGAQQFCAMRSYLSTAAKHGMHFFDALVMLTSGRPWLPSPA
jgi:transposase